jgi:acetyl esterase/lipase
MQSPLSIGAVLIGCLCALLSLLLLRRFRWSRGGPALWALKSYTAALSPYLGLLAALCALAGLAAGAWPAIVAGTFGAVVFGWYWSRVMADPDGATGFAAAFGPDWWDRIPARRRARFLKSPGGLLLPADTAYHFRPNLPFATVPGTNRRLLCDLWLPSGGLAPSGLAFIYFHGAAWYMLDKDLGTRPLFRHLASQGHVVMDVAYRLFPETDMAGMVHDVRRAIAWLKANAPAYGVDRDRIVIGGGSSGAHLALLAAYLPAEAGLTPPELAGVDLSVHAVVSAYGPADIAALYYHTDQHLTTRPDRAQPAGGGAMPAWVRRMMGADYHRLGFDKPAAASGSLGTILGCHPDECPDTYAFFSPVTHVDAHCPPTLLLHGEHDMIAPVAATRELYRRLREAGVPAVLHLLPQTDHAFDLFVPRRSPLAHAAFYSIERFLGVMETYAVGAIDRPPGPAAP